MIKKYFLTAALALLLVLASGCGAPDIPTNSGTSDAPDTDTKKILCAAFAEYDWTRQILGDNPGNIQLTLLNSSGMDMHSYQPSVADMVEIAEADLIIFTGGDSEFWIENALESSPSSVRNIIEMMEIFEQNHDLADRYLAGDVHDHGHEDEDEDADHGHEGHVHSTDEHLWLSLKMAPDFIGEITRAVSALDPANAAYYEENAASYISKINALDSRYESAAAGATHTTVLFADRYPFKYLLEDYGLGHVAAFPGCSAETEASFETILNLSEALDHLGLKAVAVLHKSDTALAQTIIKNSADRTADILFFNSMQSVTAKDIEAGAAWLSIMEDNLAALEQALS